MEDTEKIGELQDVNITSIWHKNLYDSLTKLQDLERICRDGCVSITEYLQLPASRIPEMQFQHLKMMVTEMNILINNVQIKLSKEFIIASNVKLTDMKSVIDTSPHSIFIPTINQQLNQTTFSLSHSYWLMLNDLTDIRTQIIRELADVLYGKGEEKSVAMNKSTTLVR